MSKPEVQPYFMYVMAVERKLPSFALNKLLPQAEEAQKSLNLEFIPGNSVRLDLAYFPTPLNMKVGFEDVAITFAHELMHAYGGLVDRYWDPQNTDENLMGAYQKQNVCFLRDDQINKIKKSRGLNN